MIPAGTENYWLWRGGWVDYGTIDILPAFLSGVAEHDLGLNPSRIEVAPKWGSKESPVRRLALALIAEMESGGPHGRLYADSLMTALAVVLIRGHSVFPPKGAQAGHGLSDEKLRLASDFMNAHLSETFGLKELAASVGMPLYSFCRQFKQRTGMSPHQYALRKRIERSKQLMKDPGLTLTDVAYSAGFSSQSHFSSCFRRMVGISPKAYQAQLT